MYTVLPVYIANFSTNTAPHCLICTVMLVFWLEQTFSAALQNFHLFTIFHHLYRLYWIGECEVVLNNFKCSCAGRARGRRCELNKFCDPNPCRNGARCSDGINGPTCECLKGHQGIPLYCLTLLILELSKSLPCYSRIVSLLENQLALHRLFCLKYFHWPMCDSFGE